MSPAVIPFHVFSQGVRVRATVSAQKSPCSRLSFPIFLPHVSKSPAGSSSLYLQLSHSTSRSLNPSVLHAQWQIHQMTLLSFTCCSPPPTATPAFPQAPSLCSSAELIYLARKSLPCPLFLAEQQNRSPGACTREQPRRAANEPFTLFFDLLEALCGSGEMGEMWGSLCVRGLIH